MAMTALGMILDMMIIIQARAVEIHMMLEQPSLLLLIAAHVVEVIH
jgi:hypothetical protein